MKKQHLLDRLMERADLSGEPINRVPLMELAGDRRILIENHCGITEYSEERIRIQVEYGQLCICGKGMVMAQVTGAQLVIRGCVDSIGIIRRNCP